MRQLRNTLSIAFLLMVTLSACKKEADDVKGGRSQPHEGGFVDDNIVLYWNARINSVLSAPMNQPTRARLYAMMQIAVHDALNSIVPKYKRYAITGVREQFASPDATVASAAYRVIKGLKREGTFPADDWYNESLAIVPDGQAEESGKELGKKAADAIIAKRTNDGFSQVRLASLTPPSGI